MKKTQSLKLMLLGLMSLVSTSALAAVGDIFEWGANDGAGGVLYYEEITGGAKVIGVKTVGENGLIVIPTECKNNWYSPYAALNVIALDDNWFAKTQIVLKKMAADGTVLEERPMGQSASLNDYDGLLTLQIDAAKLTKIGTDALQPLNKKIKKFVVSATAGLTAIPEYAFINGTKTTPTDDEAIAKKQAEIAELLALINGTKRVIKGGMYGDKPVFKGSTDNFTPAITGRWGNEYLFLGDEVVGNDNDGNESPLYEVFLVDSKGKVSKTNVVARRKNSNQAQLVNYSVYGNDAVLATQEPETTDYGYYNLTRDKQEAETALQTAQTNLLAYEQNTEKQLTDTRDATKAAYDAAVALQKKMQDNAVATAWNSATTPVWNAIKNGSSTGLTNEAPSYNLDTYNTIYAALVAVKWPVNAQGKFVLTDNDILHLNDAVVTKYNNYQAEEQALQTSLTTVKKPLQDALTKAENDFNAAKKALDDTVAALNKAQGELDTLNEGVAFYTVDGENKTLEEVILIGKGDLTDFGKSAFEKCVEAKFIQTNGANLPASTVNIAPRAFFNASIAPIFGKLVNLETIGNEAFANSNATTANFQNSPNLYAFGEHVFDNCKLQNLLLKGTAIEATPDGPKYPEFLAQCLYQEKVKFIDGCGYFYNYDVTNPADLAELQAKNYDQNTLVSKNGGEQLVNITLKKVSLPENIKAIPANAFMNDIALVTLDGGIPAGVKKIGDMAFFRTKIAEFDLTDLVDLTEIGEKAFAGNSELTKVILPQDKKDASGNVIAEAKMKTLGDGVFECDDDLQTVTLSPDITCLPEGTFKGNNKIEVLDLSNTQIEVLYNLFGTEAVAHINNYGEPYKVEYANTSLKRIILPSTVLDENNYAGEPVIPGLKVIMPNALAYMVGLGTVAKDGNKYGVEIPSSVEFMGDGAFFNCTNLETVTAMDSKLTTFGFNTFRNCRNLKEFTFVTLKIAQPFGDYEVDVDDLNLTNDCGIEEYTNRDGELVVHSFVTDENFFANNGSGSTKVIVTEETEDMIDKFFGKQNHGYAYLEIYQPVLTLSSGDGTLYADGYSNENYATWIPMEEADVYTAYQDVNKIYMFKGKHNEGYYKIPAAYNNPVSAPSRMAIPEPEPDPQDPQNLPVLVLPMTFDEWLAEEYGLTLEGYQALPTTAQDNISEQYDNYVSNLNRPSGDNFLEALLKTFTPGNNVYNFPQKAYSGTYIDWYFDGTDNQNGLSAAVIIIEKSNGGADGVKGKVPYERHSDSYLINQSTIDPCNQLRAVRTPIEFGDGSVSSNLYMWGYADGQPATFHHIGSGTVKAGKIVLALTRSNGAGTVYDPDPFDPSRDIEIIWVDGETTAIEYLKANTESLKTVDNAIYNLKGMRISTPVKGQMYIQNGKKFIQK